MIVNKKERFLVLDVFRGLTIFLMIVVNTQGSGALPYAAMQHADWNGCTLTDLVFPSFLFAVGNAMVFSLQERPGQTQSAGVFKSARVFKILKRSFLIFLIGYLLTWYPFIHNPFNETRIMAVLQRIALAYCLAALLVVYFSGRAARHASSVTANPADSPGVTPLSAAHNPANAHNATPGVTNPNRSIALLSVILLVVYWLLLLTLGDKGIPYSLEGNAVRKIDLRLLGAQHMYSEKGIAFDPEGLLSTLPAIVNVLAGWLAGRRILQKGRTLSAVGELALAGSILIAAGVLWSYAMPLNKKLWTSSYVCFTTGIDLLVLAILFYGIEIREWRKGTWFFSVLGRNPLFIYIFSTVIGIFLVLPVTKDRIFIDWVNDGVFQRIAPGALGALLFSLCFTMVCWTMGWILDKRKIYIALSAVALCMTSCTDDTSHLFVRMDAGHTGIDFKNILKEDDNANVLNYAYFYNGGGVAIGDINNDGLPDLLFTGNMVPNRLFLNKGNFQFEDITEKSGIARQQGWCTGATMVDINGDGKLDLYICRSGDIDPAKRRNLLFINNGDLTFTEKAQEYGLADEGYSTQAAFFDYDKDGDLDMILINHSLQQYANAAFENAALRDRHEPAFATKLYRNDNGHFTDVSRMAGITSNVLSFGLGVAVSDLNNDGWPDIYISNDFNEPDHLFINNGNGTFSEKLKDCMDQVSLYSMGSDCADIDNDGLPDLMTLDMLAEDNHTQKMHSGAENFDKFQLLFKQGFYYQYSRNMLQKNNGDGTFSEIGQLAGVSGTDWSWAALFSDFDNDGYKDLFITNGYEKDFTDMDFIKYHMSLSRSSAGARKSPAASGDLLDKMPSLSLPDYMYRNNGDNTFANKTVDWGFDRPDISSGAAYADLDNDGSMDLVVSHINEAAGIYKNQAGKMMPQNNWLKIKLQGSPQNTFGIGAKVKIYCGHDLYYQEESPVRGFQSSVDPVLNFGTGVHGTVDSLIVIWPDDRMQTLRSVKTRQTLSVNWQEAGQRWDYAAQKALQPAPLFTKTTSVPFIHRENNFNDFAVQPLMPGYLSRQGPCMAAADLNGDGREDLFVGGAKGQPGQIFIQKADGSFVNYAEPALAADSGGEATAAIFFDANHDGYPDLYVACGGYEFAEHDDALQDHLYLNDGKGHFTRSPSALPDMRFSKSCVKAADIDGDGYPDLFIGGRVVPGKYPTCPETRILLNDGKGRFRDATDEVAPGLRHIGMVTDAVWIDLDKDHREDLVVVGEWMPIKVFLNENGKLVDASDTYIKFPSSGWWNTILAADLDGDGDSDLVIGNTGLNTQFRASKKEPVTLVYKDFDGNGILDPVLCYYLGGVSYPAASRDDMMDQLPLLKKKFPEYHDYADVKISDIFTPEQLKDAATLKATTMETVYLENRGREGFVKRTLPPEAQYAPVYAIAAADLDHDGKKDLVLAGNNSWTRIKFGRYRANHGVVLRGDGKGSFTYLPQWKSGLNIREDIRSLQVIPSGKVTQWIFGANDAPTQDYILK